MSSTSDLVIAWPSHCGTASVVSRAVMGNVHITLDGLGQTLSLVGFGRVVSKFHYTDPTRPDQTHGPRGSPTSPRTLSGRRLIVRSISTCTDFVCGSGQVGSQKKSVEFRNDPTNDKVWSGPPSGNWT